MTIFKTILTGAVVIGLSACSAFDGNNEVEKLNSANAIGSPFTQQLTSEYRAFASYELNQEKDYADALHFARKGLDAAQGINVMPESINDWDLTAHDVLELSMAYSRLISAFDRGAREIIPGKSAIAQARYDCWIEEQEEVSKGINASIPCKSDFMAVMSEVEAVLPQEVAAEEFPAPVTMIDTNEPLNVAEAMYLVFFDFNSDDVNADGAAVIDAIANEITSRNLNTVRIVGHTDTSGSSNYNARLANRRATDVKAELMSRGVQAVNVIIEGRGENELLVTTADNIREPANRRAVITFE